jgi:N-acetylglutamate synthase-like GNAT family acetyltransferase
LRRAAAADQRAIRRLIYQVRINPRGLDWRGFVVAVDDGGQVVGCGQIKPHRDGSRELASIAVDPDWRGGGVARAIITDLMQVGPPLWLVCRAQLTPYYRQFGFREILASEASTPHLRRLLRLGRWLRRLVPEEHAPFPMVWETAELTPAETSQLQGDGKLKATAIVDRLE